MIVGFSIAPANTRPFLVHRPAAAGERALLYLTDCSRVVYIPTTKGYTLLRSPMDPNGLLGGLRTRVRTN